MFDLKYAQNNYILVGQNLFKISNNLLYTHRWAFVGMMGCESTKHNIQNSLAAQYTVEYKCTLVITWLPKSCSCCCRCHCYLPFSTQHHKKVSCCLWLAWGKIKLQSTACTEKVCFHTPEVGK